MSYAVTLLAIVALSGIAFIVTLLVVACSLIPDSWAVKKAFRRKNLKPFRADPETGEHPRFTVRQWIRARMDRVTDLGYEDWVNFKIHERNK